MIIDPNAEGFGYRGDTADDGPGFPWDLVDFGQDVKIWELQAVLGLDNAMRVSRAKEFAFKEESCLSVIILSIVNELFEDGPKVLCIDCQGVGHFEFLVIL